MESGAGRPILVVDDDEIILSSIEFVLSEEGFPVVVALNGKEAIQRVSERTFCLILLDMKMPVMDGWAFAEEYRKLPAPHAPIIVMTAAQDSRSRADEIGAAGYLAKPFELDHLLTLVSRYAAQG